jgi:hypothetical protein
LLGFVFSSVFPLLFLQTGTVWNSIQFWYYALIFADILAALAISGLMNHLKLPIKYLFLGIFILLTVPAFFKTMKNKFDNFHAFPITQLNFLQNLSAKDNLLVCPEDSILFKSAFINAYTNARVYLSDEGQLNLIDADLKPVVELKTIFAKRQMSEIESLINREKINYILCTNKDFIEVLDKRYPSEKQEIIDWSIYSLK